ncbi:MAG: HlyD family efflux transporter periplasmic adaptor subunit, partial [Bacteroidota bacterium]
HISKFNFKAMKTIKNVILCALFGILLSACGGNEEQSSKQQEAQPTVNAASESAVQVIRKSDLELRTIKNGTVTSYLPITGRVIPKYTTQLVAEVQGRVLLSKKPFKSGSAYRKGEVLLRIDSQEFALNLESQKSAFLNILTGMMPDLKADYPENYQNWLTYINNYQSGLPLPVLPETKSNPEKYFITSQQVYNTYYNIKAQEERLRKFTLTAPYSGSLSAAMVDNGGLVSPGQPLGTFISDRDYEVEAAVTLELAQQLKIGQNIELYNKSLNETFKAKVIRINNIVDPNTQNIPVFLKVSDEKLRSGMYLEGKVRYNTFENAVKIPATAINRDNTVHLLEEGVIRKETIEIMNSEVTEAVVSGLDDNTQLILNSFQNPVSGLKILE